MKILYIPSGYVKIYSFFDECIMNVLHSLCGIDCKRYDIQKDIKGLKDICLSFKPDAIVTMIGEQLPVEWVEWLRNNGIKTVLWLTEDPYYIDQSMQLIPHYDYVFTIDRGAQSYYLENGYSVNFLPLGTDIQTFTPKLQNRKYQSDLCLIGFPYKERVQIINHLSNNTEYKILLAGRGWSSYVKRTKNSKVVKGWLHPSKIAHYYSNAKIVLNPHRNYLETSNENGNGVVNNSINNRSFDIAACGAFQLIEHKEDIDEHFVIGQEIISYTKIEDLLDKIQFYMENEVDRLQIAKNARNRVLQDHTFQKRLEVILKNIL